MPEAPARLKVADLGPVRARVGDRDVTPEGRLQRRLLALLVLRRGRVVPASVAIEALWPSEVPKDPSAALQNHLSRLRSLLPDGVTESVADGYRLEPTLVDVDSDRLAALVDDLMDDRVSTAAASELAQLTDRWRGPAYPELDDFEPARAEVAALEDLRVRAREALAEHALDQGDVAGALTTLTALVSAEPLRERPRSLLMRALAADGRRVEALRVYDDFRRLLGDELGIEPSPLLTAEHAALLEGGPAPTPASLAPVSAAGWRPATRLPVPPTALIGRDAQMEELLAAIEGQRLVTLVGPGGVGKTRLAIELGHRLRGRADLPVVFCGLAKTDEESAVDAVAAALDIDVRPDVPTTERIASVLGDAPAVVVLDNCEHVIEPVAALVETLLTGCPDVLVVATSRERLRVPGEVVREVPPLESEGEAAPGVTLFLERARAVAPDFDPASPQLEAVREIVRRLDGLPLAIELAASRLLTHDLAEVAAGLDRRFALLDSGYRTSTRHGSLRAAVSWSYDLLQPALQERFVDLAAFAGPFPTRWAAALWSDDDARAAATLAQLRERSLLVQPYAGRHLLLETLREFAAEQLEAEGRADVVRGRHARNLVEWTRDASERLLIPGERAIDEIDEAVPELRSAVQWLVDHGETDAAGRLVVDLLSYGFLRLRPDVLAWADAVAAADPEGRSPHAPEVLTVCSYAIWMAGDIVRKRQLVTRSMELARSGSGRLSPEVSAAWASCALFEGDLETAATWYERSAADAVPGSRQHLLSTASALLARGYARDPEVGALASDRLQRYGDAATPFAAYLWYCSGEAVLATDPATAQDRFERALELAAATRAAFVTGLAGTSRASIEARTGDPEVAAAAYRDLIQHWRRAGMWSTQWTMLRAIVGLLARLGQPEAAAVLEGAVRSGTGGHRIFGEDEVLLAQIGAELRAALGDDAYERARRDGAVLDGEEAVEHALRHL